MPTHEEEQEFARIATTHDRQLFDKKPIRAIASFLKCFDPEGGRFRDVPPYVLEFLAERFQSFMRADFKSLDKAFGGSTARQRNSINRENVIQEVVFDFFGEYEAARKMTRDERGKNTPYEVAVARTAEKHNLSEDTVRDIYKKSGK